ESSPVREASTALYRELIDGSTVRVNRQLKAQLPELLWLYSLGVILFWVHDSSPGCAKTYTLIDRTVPIADRLISLSRLPLLSSTLTDVISIIDEIRG
ncbi:MAG: TetR/AcrR family transcriptional regulator, partial [Actinobacteria bacterium]|nr:TetR/AcrR family transcriptional regulator [Actinomycetota bacterium]